jgi:hypothetical protein
MARFERTNGVSPDLDRAQRRIAAGEERGRAFDAEGARIRLTITDSRSVSIGHKLGRKPQGFREVSRKGDGVGTLVLDSATGKQCAFSLKVPSGAPATSHTYELWIY